MPFAAWRLRHEPFTLYVAKLGADFGAMGGVRGYPSNGVGTTAIGGAARACGGILQNVVRDLRTSSTWEAQRERSLDREPGLTGSTEETAAQKLAVLRARAGFNVNQLVAKYRALRASVRRLCLMIASLERPIWAT